MRKERPPRSFLLKTSATAICSLFFFPTIYLIVRNFTEGARPGELILSSRTLEPLKRTLLLAIAVSICAMLIGSSLAWLVTRTNLSFRRFWQVALAIPLVFPSFIGAAAFNRTLSKGGSVADFLENFGVQSGIQFRGFWGAWFVLTLFTYPYVYLPVAAKLRHLPVSLEESARVLGNRPLATFRNICLPQLLPSIISGTLLVTLYTISDFGVVQLMRYDTLARAIATNHLAQPAVALAISLILLVLAALVVSGERMLRTKTNATETKHSPRAVQYPLGRFRFLAHCFVWVIGLLAVVAPLAALSQWALGGIIRATKPTSSLTIDFEKILSASWGSIWTSVIAAFISVAVVLPIAFLAGRHRSKTGTVGQIIILSTFAMPGLLIALSVRFWTLRSELAYEWFGDSSALLIFAYVVRFGALALGVCLVAVIAVPKQLHEAAITLGASPRRRFRKIDLPIMAPSLLAGAGLVLLSVLKELPISLLVSPLGFTNLTSRIFMSFEDAFVAEAGIMAVVLVSISFALTWFLVLSNAEHR